MILPRRWLALLLLCVLAAFSAAAIDLVVPNSKAFAEGDFNNGFPFSDSSSTHYQQVYDASQFSLLGTNGGSVNYIGFRYNGNYNTAPMTYNSMVVRLSTTTQAVDNLSTTFANNVGADSTIVFSGRYLLGVTPPPSDHQLHPWPFPMIIPFTTSFQYNPTNGNLLFDIQWTYANLYAGNGPPFNDEVESATDSVSRLFAENIYETYIPTNGTADTFGLVTMFGVTPAVPPAPRIDRVDLSDTNIIVGGSGGAPGVVYTLLASTNIAAPLVDWTPVVTNTFLPDGSFTITNSLDPLVQGCFFLLQLQ